MKLSVSKALVVLFAFSLSGCMAPLTDHFNPAVVGVKDRSSNWYSERYALPNDAEIVADTYSDADVYMKFPHGDGVYHYSRPVDFYSFLWDASLQQKMNNKITRIAGGNSANWKHRGVRYRFVATGELFYSPHNNKACRHGTLYRENSGQTHAWEKIPSTFCKIGPNGEWLPLV